MARQVQAAEGAPATRGTRILVVDDEGDVAALLADMLSIDDHHVDTAPNGATALEKLRQRSYDLILTDIKMPELDGPGLYRELERRHLQLHRRPIFLTGDTLSADTRAFLEQAGAPSSSKPFGWDDVRRAVRQALSSVEFDKQ